MVTDDGRVKVLDFGLARAVDVDVVRLGEGVTHLGTQAPDSALRPASPAASIAVLAFSDMSAAKDQDWFCDGIAEEILNALAPLEGLRVAARTSAFSFKGKGDDLRTIGEKLNVTTVLEGSVRRAGDRVRITVQLSDAANGFQLWSERYDRELKDVFDVQDEIAKAIAERLKVTLTGGKDDRLVEQATASIEAYQLYLKGHALLGRRGTSIPAALAGVPHTAFGSAVCCDRARNGCVSLRSATVGSRRMVKKTHVEGEVSCVRSFD